MKGFENESIPVIKRTGSRHLCTVNDEFSISPECPQPTTDWYCTCVGDHVKTGTL